MNLILAVILGLIALFLHEREQFIQISCENRSKKRKETFDIINPCIGSNWDILMEINKRFKSSETRQECFNMIDREMRYIFGTDDWRDLFVVDENSEFIWQSPYLTERRWSDVTYHSSVPYCDPESWIAIRPEVIVYYVLLAKHGLSASEYKAKNIIGLQVEEQPYDILKRAYHTIERLLKERHPELGSALNMYVWNSDNGDEKILFRFEVESLQLKNVRLL